MDAYDVYTFVIYQHRLSCAKSPSIAQNNPDLRSWTYDFGPTLVHRSRGSDDNFPLRTKRRTQNQSRRRTPAHPELYHSEAWPALQECTASSYIPFRLASMKTPCAQNHLRRSNEKLSNNLWGSLRMSHARCVIILNAMHGAPRGNSD